MTVCVSVRVCVLMHVRVCVLMHVRVCVLMHVRVGQVCGCIGELHRDDAAQCGV
jgi:hypothetical protein